MTSSFFQAFERVVVFEEAGFLRLDIRLPDHVRNPRGQLFGGFTPTYVDLVSLYTVRAGPDRATAGANRWFATTNMRIDYFEPILGPKFVIESQLEKSRGRTHMVVTRFFQDDVLAVLALTTLRETPPAKTLGDG